MRPYPVAPALSEGLIADNLQTVDNIRLWDHGPLLNVYRQIQQIRPYYDFQDADVDRYTVDGEYRQVMLAAREVAQEKLEDDAQRWINTRLRFTHGFGVAMSPVTDFTPRGPPGVLRQGHPQRRRHQGAGLGGRRTGHPYREPPDLLRREDDRLRDRQYGDGRARLPGERRGAQEQQVRRQRRRAHWAP